MTHAQAVVLLELVVDAAQVAAAIGGEEGTGIFTLLAIAEEGAEHARHALVPGQLHEGFRFGNADELGGLRAVAKILAAAVHEEVDGGAVDELEAAIGDVLPVVGRNALAHDAAGDRHELEVEVLDAERVDLLAHLLDEISAPRSLDEVLVVGHRHFLPCFSCWGLLPRELNSQSKSRLSAVSNLSGQLQGNGLLDTGCSLPSA